jgi:poly-gamma-glutamate synthesis protein (capsule biosynthesis protein)
MKAGNNNGISGSTKLKYKKADFISTYPCLFFSIFIILLLCCCGCRSDDHHHDMAVELYPYEEKNLDPYSFVLAFAGDINFDEQWSTMRYYNSVENGIRDCICPELIRIMQDADVMCLNNEFTYSSGGSPLKGKAFTFRAHPTRVDILKELGVDIVSLANNHVYDYGEQSLIDTMATLKEAQIPYFGAGHDLDEAMAPVYFEIQGKIVGYVAASRAEKFKMTPQATEDAPGILRCYDTTLFVKAIQEARKNADHVIAFVHWGTENSHVLEEVQLATGKEYIDAGADIVIGAHPHCLQGMEFHDGKPIVYSLGNFWFNDQTVDTMLLKVHFYGDDNEEFMKLEIVPAIQSNLTTTIVTDPSEKKRIYSFLEDISINVVIDEGGIISEKKEDDPGEILHSGKQFPLSGVDFLKEHAVLSQDFTLF